MVEIQSLPVCLTGGIATGKTRVGEWFVEKGWEVISTDEIVHRLYSTDLPLINNIAAEFGLEVDELGLDEVDRKVLLSMIDKFGGGPVGIETIAAATGEEADTIMDVYEPFLIQLGFLARTPRGRIATPNAYEHLGRVRPPQSADAQTRLF